MASSTTANKDELLLGGIIAQVSVQKLDYDKIATAINVGTPKAARHRWDKFKKNPKVGNEALLKAVLEQSEIGKIDFDNLAQHIGCGTPKAARHRWDKYKKKMGFTVGTPRPRKIAGTPKKDRAAPRKAIKKEMAEDDDEDEDVTNDQSTEGDNKMVIDRKTPSPQPELLADAAQFYDSLPNAEY